MVKYRIMEDTSSDGLTRYRIEEHVPGFLGGHWENVFLVGPAGIEPITREDCERTIERWLKPVPTWTTKEVKRYG